MTMKKKAIYTTPLTEILKPAYGNVCGVDLSTVEGNTDYNDIYIGGNDDDEEVAPTSNNLWYDPNEEE